MRVIAGEARGHKLFAPDGLHTRPTADRVKEALFSVLAPDIRGCAFLDLYSGSGAIGIEALSRGAAWAVFVDEDHHSAACIQKNLEKTRMGHLGQVMTTPVSYTIASLARQKASFDIIFMDPPYGGDHIEETLKSLAQTPILREGGLVIAETAADQAVTFASRYGFHLIKEKQYNIARLVFWQPDREGASKP